MASATSQVSPPEPRLPALLELYRHLHRQPELSFQETATAARLASELRAVGFEVTEKVGGHGVVGVLANGDGPTVLVRCDMDALPIEEQTGVGYASLVRAELDGKQVPVMHACGHDVHMAVWVGTAATLASSKDSWRGRVVFIAQPAEEKGAGAQAMLEDGLFERWPKPDYALALHVASWLPAGVVALAPGAVLASSESCEILVQGRGGHGSAPHLTVDPVVLAARIVLGLQTVISRDKDPQKPGVISVGSIHGGTKHNIIPDQVKLELTIRSYDPEVHQQLRDGIVRTCRGEAVAVGAPEPRVTFAELTPATVNHPELTARVKQAFQALQPKLTVLPAVPVMAAEDFSRYGLAGVPALMFWLGSVSQETLAAARKAGTLPGLHTATFAPDPEPTLRTGVRAMTAAALELLRK